MEILKPQSLKTSPKDCALIVFLLAWVQCWYSPAESTLASHSMRCLSDAQGRVPPGL